ncbi:unnamed protein product [Clavelina lepadiformis]|uniref:Phospholipase A-2-activating protein n=1 Tax=Clavelina lepadiformis TaxID=159417 RepID=A0ABP0G5Z2_CLALP
MSSQHYKYVCTLRGHNADVRGLCEVQEKGILSCSRDLTTKLWISSGENDYKEQSSYTGHKNFVLCVAMMTPLKDVYPDGLILTGSSDHHINVYMPTSCEPIMSLVGHSNTVCSMVAGLCGTVVSGSWDYTARLWLFDSKEIKDAKCVMIMSGHTAAVWDVMIMPGQQRLIVTASADKTIKIWRTGKCSHTLEGHSDCVRSLSALSLSQFLSCSNDASVKRWSVEGQCLQTYYGHSNFIYSVCSIPDKSEFVTCSEDRTLKVWTISEGNPIQTIPLPAQSLWKVIVLINGDIAVGCNDSTIRIFSKIRSASPDNQASFQQELSTSEIPGASMELGDLNVDNLPGVEALEKSGERDGQTLMVSNQGKVEAYKWNNIDGKWVKVGDVVGSNATGKKSVYQGKEYDYVFTIDIEEGKPPLHLPYNLTEDPWFAAQKFIDDNVLGQHFLDTIVNFIVDNTKGANAQYQTASQYSDPFTGEGRYMPNTTEGQSSGGADPFTGSGRYIPSNNNSSGSRSGTDPYTGGGRYVPESSASRIEPSQSVQRDPILNPSRYIPDSNGNMQKKISVSNQYFPKTDYILFNKKNVSAMIGKIKEFAEIIESPLSSEDLMSLENMTNPDYNPVSHEIEKLWRMLHWNADVLFPILDFVRYSSINQLCIVQTICSNWAEEFLNMLLEILRNSSCKNAQTNVLLALRILCNLFSSTDGLAFLLAGCNEICNAVAMLLPADGAESVHGVANNVQVAIATLHINYAVCFINKSSYSSALASLCDDARLCCLRSSLTFVGQAKCIGLEALFRHLVGLGTMISRHEIARVTAKSLNVQELVEVAADVFRQSSKVAECSRYLLLAL